jgi:hypothetical protein
VAAAEGVCKNREKAFAKTNWNIETILLTINKLSCDLINILKS